MYPVLGALCDAGHVLAIAVSLATSHSHTAPCPISASVVATDNNDVVATARDGTASVDVLHGQAGDGNAAGGVALEVTTLVVLLDEDTVS